MDICKVLIATLSDWDSTLTTELANTLLRFMPNVSKACLEWAEDHDYEGRTYIVLNVYYQWLDNQV